MGVSAQVRPMVHMVLEHFCCGKVQRFHGTITYIDNE